MRSCELNKQEKKNIDSSNLEEHEPGTATNLGAVRYSLFIALLRRVFCFVFYEVGSKNDLCLMYCLLTAPPKKQLLGFINHPSNVEKTQPLFALVLNSVRFFFWSAFCGPYY